MVGAPCVQCCLCSAIFDHCGQTWLMPSRTPLWQVRLICGMVQMHLIWAFDWMGRSKKV